jgi:CheY-like chemotaxis protein/two-component sensor histidine kinase
MRRQIQHMVRLIDDLLDVGRITRDKLVLQRQRIDLVALLRQAIDDSRPLCDERRHALDISLPDEPVWIDGDPTRLAQVVGNLLNNACKYTLPSGQIALAMMHDGAEARITVKDTGIGIHPEDLPRMFEMFAQVHHDQVLAQGGLGIGLSLVKRLVEMHGGTIDAHSEGPGTGSTFEVRLPILAEPSALPSETMGKPSALAADGINHNILVVDDNKDAAQALARLLKLHGAQTTVAHDGPEAIDAAERVMPDLIFLDIGLPSMTGYDVCRELRRRTNGTARRPMIIALTGWGQDSDRTKSADAGFDHHLDKPVHFDKLVALLAKKGE